MAESLPETSLAAPTAAPGGWERRPIQRRSNTVEPGANRPVSASRARQTWGGRARGPDGALRELAKATRAATVDRVAALLAGSVKKRIPAPVLLEHGDERADVLGTELMQPGPPLTIGAKVADSLQSDDALDEGVLGEEVQPTDNGCGVQADLHIWALGDRLERLPALFSLLAAVAVVREDRAWNSTTKFALEGAVERGVQGQAKEASPGKSVVGESLLRRRQGLLDPGQR